MREQEAGTLWLEEKGGGGGGVFKARNHKVDVKERQLHCIWPVLFVLKAAMSAKREIPQEYQTQGSGWRTTDVQVRNKEASTSSTHVLGWCTTPIKMYRLSTRLGWRAKLLLYIGGRGTGTLPLLKIRSVESPP